MSSVNLDNIPELQWQKLWEGSPSLSSAYWYYQRKEVKAQYKSLKAKGGREAQTKIFIENLDNPEVTDKAKTAIERNFPDGPNGFLSAVATILTGVSELHKHSVPEKKKEYEALRKSLKESCLRWIKEGSLYALGFPKNRRPQDRACLVPVDLIANGHYNWEENRIFHTSLEMIDIRIVHSESIKAIAQNVDSENTNRSKINGANKQKIASPNIPNPPLGRPTKKDLILQAFEFGVENDAINFSQSKKIIFSTVQQIIREQWPDEYEGGKGLGTTPMRKYLLDKINHNKL